MLVIHPHAESAQTPTYLRAHFSFLLKVLIDFGDNYGTLLTTLSTNYFKTAAKVHKELQKTVKFLADYLDRVAAITPALPEIGPPRLFRITVDFSKTRYTFNALQTPASIRERADILRRSGPRYGGLTEKAYKANQAANWKPLLSRPRKPIKSVAQQFLDDGEKENWAAYQGLFDA